MVIQQPRSDLRLFPFQYKEFKMNEILSNCEMSEKMQVVIRRNCTEDMKQDHLVRTLWPQEDIYVPTDIAG